MKTYSQFITERKIHSKLIKLLHEGVKMVPISKLNEGATTDFAKKEIDLIIKSARAKNDTSLIEPFVPEMMSLIKKFGDSGQSGGSAPFTAGAIVGTLKKLLLQEPATPVTGEDDEWNDVSDISNQPENTLYQNKRCYALFKDNDGPYYVDAIVWKNQDGITWSGNALITPDGERISSSQFVKEFPFEPKTFVVDIEEKEIAPDDWEFHIKDQAQLDDVFKYYNKKPIKK